MAYQEPPRTTAFQAKLLSHVASNPGITDRELSDVLLGKTVHSSRVNQEARLLAGRGQILRHLREDKRVGNFPVASLARKQLANMLDRLGTLIRRLLPR
jgi:hypothetical protein